MLNYPSEATVSESKIMVDYANSAVNDDHLNLKINTLIGFHSGL